MGKVAHELSACVRSSDVIVEGAEGDVTFEGLALSPKTLEGLAECGFSRPSPIQLKAIPLGRCGFDLIVEAKSGTGKTAVFGIVALEMLIESDAFQVLILAPTREIASQVGHVLKSIGSAYKLNVEIVMGGTNIIDDIERLKSKTFQILVGSPGRVLHLIKKNIISTKSVRLMVLDEADKLLEESFQKDINRIYASLPDGKQVIAASATYTDDLRDFLRRYMRTPSHVRPDASSVLIGVSQQISVVPSHENSPRQNLIKFQRLLQILSQTPFKQCLVFCKYQMRAQSICDDLKKEGWPADFIAGSQKQSERLNSLKKLQTFSCRILVATDLVARGIDASDVNLVVNIDPPDDSATYLHRIGRSGRYGSTGLAITILSTKEEPIFIAMMKTVGGIDDSTIKSSSIIYDDLKKNSSSKSQELKEKETGTKDVDSYLMSLMLSNEKKPVIESFSNIVKSFNNANECQPNLNLFESRLNILEYICSSYPETTVNLENNSIENVISKIKDLHIPSMKKVDKNNENDFNHIVQSNVDHLHNVSRTSAVYQTADVNKGRRSRKSKEIPVLGKNVCDIRNNYEQYKLWRSRLATISNQIEQNVYMNTLLGIDYY